MHISRLRIKNYRSISELDLAFKKGKNVIVGKNNAGKSNIIQAIDILLGEGSPTYQKSENISENDFHKGNKDQHILLFCVLERERDELIGYDEIYNNCFGFKIHSTNRTPERHTLSKNSLAEFWYDLETALNIEEEDNNSFYVSRKRRENRPFEVALGDKYIFAYAFRATFHNGKIHKQCRLFYKESKTNEWIMTFSANIRTEFLQCAIIPSFRDPQSELRINQWSWYGKLLRNHINADDPELTEAFNNLKNVSDTIFGSLKNRINDSQVKVAFPDTSISFQFNPDTKVDVYKSTLIYVNDGFNSLLQHKGSGIQSAVIIGLFHYYTRNHNHTNCSLLAIEEPELYLHPQARRVISNRIDEFLEGNRNQVILTTHSTEFITSAHDNFNIISIRKDKALGTVGKNTTFDDSKEKQILIKSQNSEMFFADKVILVEGGEKYILEAASKYYGKVKEQSLGENWLNDKNCSVIAVGGKTEFGKYYNKLTELGIDCYILADFDFLLRQFASFLTNVKSLSTIKDKYNAFNSQISSNRNLAVKILDKINEFKGYLQSEGLKIDSKEIQNKLKEPLRIKKFDQIKEEHKAKVQEFMHLLRTYNIFILSGELENYFSDECKQKVRSIQGKEEKPIYIVSQLVSEAEDIIKLINCEEYFDLLDLVTTDYRLSEEIESTNQSEVTSEIISSPPNVEEKNDQLENI